MKIPAKRLFALALAICMVASMAACADNQASEQVSQSTQAPTVATQAPTVATEAIEAAAPTEVTLVCDGTANYKLVAEDRDSDFDGNYVFAQYFPGGTQEAMVSGIRELISKGAVSVNGLALPTYLADMEQAEDGNYTYSTNGAPAITVDDTATAEDIWEQGLAAITSDVKSAGTNVTFALDADGYATEMSLFITRGALIDEIRDNGDGTSTLIAEGSPYSVSLGGGMMGGGVSVQVVFPNENIDPTVATGDIVVCYADAQGWHIQAADKMEGYLIGGADHEDYLFRDMEGTIHYLEDANMYNRAFATQNRPGGFVNTQNNFALTEKDYPVIAWFVPGTLSTEKPMIIGFTTGDSARLRLADAIAYATGIADNAVVASSREEAGEGVDWVEDAATIEALRTAIAKAQAVYDDATATGTAVDGAVYDLHLAIWGSLSDISAVYMGTAQEGFFDIANPDQEKAAPVELK